MVRILGFIAAVLMTRPNHFRAECGVNSRHSAGPGDLAELGGFVWQECRIPVAGGTQVTRKLVCFRRFPGYKRQVRMLILRRKILCWGRCCLSVTQQA